VIFVPSCNVRIVLLIGKILRTIVLKSA